MIRELLRPAVRLVKVTVRRERWQLAGLAGWSVVEALPVFVSGHTIARALDGGFLAGRPLAGLGWLGALAAAVLVGAVGVGKGVAGLGTIVDPLHEALLRRVVRGTLAKPGVEAARLVRQAELVRDAFGELVMVVRAFTFTTIAALAGLLTLLPLTAPLAVAPLAVAVVLLAGLLPAMVPRRQELVLAGERVEAESGATVRLTMSTLCLGVGGWLPVVLLLAFSPWLLRGGASTGEVIGAVVFVMYGLRPALACLVHGLCGSGVTLVVTVHRLLEATAVRPCRDGWGSRQVWQHGNDVVAEHLTFAYGRRAEPVVRDLSLRLPDGDHLAVLGPSGIGKSTLAQLLAGMLHPDSGQVTLAGASPRCFDPAQLARRRVLVPQEPYVFTGTLADNLRYLNPHAPRLLLASAASAVGLAMPLDHALDPVRLTRAERQLIALARAYASPARFVILDEAACHLTPEAEARVEEAFAARPGTLLVIAHRTGSALRARRVLVLDGAHATLGTHEHLLERSALYRDLINGVS